MSIISSIIEFPRDLSQMMNYLEMKERSLRRMLVPFMANSAWILFFRVVDSATSED